MREPSEIGGSARPGPSSDSFTSRAGPHISAPACNPRRIRMGLNQAELEAVDQLIAMGIELEPAQRAVEVSPFLRSLPAPPTIPPLQKHGINLEAAMESIFETAAADDGPPPLISVDDDELPPPYGPPNSTSDLYGPIDYRQVAIRQPNPSPSTSVVPFSKPCRLMAPPLHC